MGLGLGLGLRLGSMGPVLPVGPVGIGCRRSRGDRNAIGSVSDLDDSTHEQGPDVLKWTEIVCKVNATPLRLRVRVRVTRRR